MSTHTPQKVPEHFSRVDIGAYMRELRLHYGLSEQDVSERLHIRVKYVAAIENAQFDLMPGKAYARGYVHTYAEFLGLDADQIVERCFGGEMAREVQPHSIPASANWYKRNRAYGGVVAVLMLLGGLFYFATQGENAPNIETVDGPSAVESVPEEYLASMRNRLMPNAQNYPCLGEQTPLGCYFSQRLTKSWIHQAVVPNMSPVRVDEAPAPKAVPKDEVKQEAAPKKEPSKSTSKKPVDDERTHVYRPPPPPGLKSTEADATSSENTELPDPNLAIPEESAAEPAAAEGEQE